MRSLSAPIATMALACVATLAIASCSSDHSTIAAGPDGLQTFTVVRESNGAPVLCSTARAAKPLEGILRGSPTAAEPVWLELGDGQNVSVVWPEGFNVRFTPGVELRDGDDNEVAREGQLITLEQVNIDPQKGSASNPYVAAGIVRDVCYPFVP